MGLKGLTIICAASEASTLVSLATSLSNPRKDDVPVGSETENTTRYLSDINEFHYLVQRHNKLKREKNYLSSATALVSLHEGQVNEDSSRTSFFEHREQPI